MCGKRHPCWNSERRNAWKNGLDKGRVHQWLITSACLLGMVPVKVHSGFNSTNPTIRPISEGIVPRSDISSNAKISSPVSRPSSAGMVPVMGFPLVVKAFQRNMLPTCVGSDPPMACSSICKVSQSDNEKSSVGKVLVNDNSMTIKC